MQCMPQLNTGAQNGTTIVRSCLELIMDCLEQWFPTQLSGLPVGAMHSITCYLPGHKFKWNVTTLIWQGRFFCSTLLLLPCIKCPACKPEVHGHLNYLTLIDCSELVLLSCTRLYLFILLQFGQNIWKTRLGEGSFHIGILTLVQLITEKRLRHVRGPVHFNIESIIFIRK